MLILKAGEVGSEVWQEDGRNFLFLLSKSSSQDNQQVQEVDEHVGTFIKTIPEDKEKCNFEPFVMSSCVAIA